MISQTLFDTYTNIDFTEDYNIQRKQVDSLLSICKQQDDLTSMSLIASDFAIRGDWESRLKEAIYYTTIAIDAIETEKEDIVVLVTYYFRRGLFKEKLNEVQHAIIDYEKVVSLGLIPSRAGQSYCRMGNVYRAKGDFYEAISYYNKGIHILEAESDYKRLAKEYRNLAMVYDQLGDKNSLLKKIEILKKVEDLKEKVTFSKQNQFHLNRSFALTYVEPAMFDFNKSKKYHFDNISIFSRDNDDDKEYLCSTYLNLADLYNTIKKDSALYYINRSLQYCVDSLNLAQGNNHLSTYYTHKKEYPKALESIQKTLQYIGFNSNTIEKVPSIAFLENSYDQLYLVDVFEQKAKILFEIGKREQSNYYLELALKNITISDVLLTIIQNDDKEERSQYYWQEMAASVYANGVAIASELENQERVFYFVEKNKALLLTTAIVKNAKKEALPDRIAEKEKNRLKTILKLKYTIETANKDEITVLQNKLFEEKKAFQLFRDSLQNKFPDYYKKLEIPTVVSLQNAQQSLSEKEAVVSYIWGDKKESGQMLYALLMTKEEMNIVKVASLITLATTIDRYKELVSRPFETKNDKDEFSEISRELYQQLLPFQEQLTQHNIEKLVVVPDGKLQNLPFESLLTGEENDSYLIKFMDVSYAYSLSFLMYNNTIKRDNKEGFAGFAPVAYKGTQLPDLPDTKREISSIKDIMEGTAYIEDTAVKENFFTKTRESNIIHLATHADATNNPWIAFADDKLQLHELYTFQNRPELVVLSACNTAIGEVVRGEGIISLTRGFFYAGANTVVSNAWNANDKSTAFIMKEFYKNLEAGKTKSESLRQAKLRYINSHSLSETSPSYWASLMLVGDYGAITQSNYTTTILFISIALFVLGILTYFFIKKR